MQYLQKFIGKEAGIGYSFGRSVPSHDPANVWTLHEGVSKETGDSGLVFVFDAKNDRSGEKTKLAQAGMQRLKTLRHPDVLKYLVSAESSDGSLQIATEKATPLAEVLANSTTLDRDAAQWGLVCLSRALDFLHKSQLVHGRVCPATVFVTPSGDWKLAGFEVTQAHANIASLRNSLTLQMEQYRSPEEVRGMWSGLSDAPVHVVDAWALGCLIFAVHNGRFRAPEELRNVQSLPKALLPLYQRLLTSNPTNRATCGELKDFEYFKNARFVELNLFLDNLAIKDSLEKEAFLTKLPTLIEKLPREFCVHKVLPVLCQSIELGIGGTQAFASIVKMRARMDDDEFKQKVVLPFASKWFTSSTAPLSLRLDLLQNMSMFSALLEGKILNDKIFPALIAALSDQTSPALRDAAVKACVHIAPQINERNLNGALMSKFASLQVDPEPAIRTNTTVCIGKLAQQMTAATRQKVLVPAFARALKDPFPPARCAGLVAYLSTQELYSVTDIGQRIYPAVAPMLVDADTDVRTQAFKVIDSLRPRLQSNHEEFTRRAAAASAADKAGTAAGGKTGASDTSLANKWGGLTSLSSITSALIGGDGKGEGGKPTSANLLPAPARVSTSSSAAQGAVPAAMSTAGASQVLASWDNSAPPAPAEAANGDNDDDDDGWGDDLNVFDAGREEEKNGAAASVMSSFQGNPADVIAWRKTAAVGGAHKSVSNDGWDAFTSAASPRSTSRPAPAPPSDNLWDLLPPAKPTTTMNKATGTSSSARKPASKGGSADDWESILGASSAAPATKRRGLGAVRR